MNQEVFNYLRKHLNNIYATIAIYLEIEAQSDFNPKYLEPKGKDTLQFTESEYTALVDLNKYTDFSTDGYKYGLLGWNSKKSKLFLLNFAKTKNKSVGDLKTQLDYIIIRLIHYLSTTHTIEEAVVLVCAGNFYEKIKKGKKILQEINKENETT